MRVSGSRLANWIDKHAQVTTAQFVAAIAHFGVELSIKEAEAFFGRYTAELHRAGRGAALRETQPHHPSRCQRISLPDSAHSPRRIDLELKDVCALHVAALYCVPMQLRR